MLSVKIHQCRNYLLARFNLRSEDFHLRLRKEKEIGTLIMSIYGYTGTQFDD